MEEVHGHNYELTPNGMARAQASHLLDEEAMPTVLGFRVEWPLAGMAVPQSGIFGAGDIGALASGVRQMRASTAVTEERHLTL